MSITAASFTFPTSNLGVWFYKLIIKTENGQTITYAYGLISVKGPLDTAPT